MHLLPDTLIFVKYDSKFLWYFSASSIFMKPIFISLKLIVDYKNYFKTYSKLIKISVFTRVLSAY